jgi:hypothetical protein
MCPNSSDSKPDIELYVSVHNCTIQCPRINACFESLPHGLFLTCRGEIIFRCREVYGMHNDNNVCDKDFKRKVFKAFLLKGTVARDFLPLVFFMNRTHLLP